MLRLVIRCLCVIDLMAIVFIAVAAVVWGGNDEAVPTWHWLLVIPAMNACGAGIMLLLSPAFPTLRDDDLTSSLLIACIMPPMAIVLVPVLLASRRARRAEAAGGDPPA